MNSDIMDATATKAETKNISCTNRAKPAIGLYRMILVSIFSNKISPFPSGTRLLVVLTSKF
jgi:hypothetical protein